MTEQFVYGLHAVAALLLQQHRPVFQLYLNQERKDKRLEALLGLATTKKILVEMMSSQAMNQRFKALAHQGAVAQVGQLPSYHDNDLKSMLANLDKPAAILILDNITDPHNLGACLRTAEAAGVDFIITPKNNSVGITSVVSKVASGAVELIPVIQVTNLARAIDVLKNQGIWVYGAAAEAEQTIYQLDLSIATAIVMGAEGDGLRRLTKTHCDGLFSLPMHGAIASLNVSVAAGIALYEQLRQRALANNTLRQ